MKKIVVILLSVIIILAILTGGAYIYDYIRMEKQQIPLFSYWGYKRTDEPPLLVITDNNKITAKGLIGTSSWDRTHSDYPSPENRQYAPENTVVLKEQTVFFFDGLKGKVKYLRLLKDKMYKDIAFDKNSFEIEYLYPGTYYLEVIVGYPQGVVCYNIKVVREIDSIEIKKSATKDIKAVYGKIKPPYENHQSAKLSYEYTVYYYGISEVYLKYKESRYPLFNALNSNMISAEDIIEKCEKDAKNGFITSEMYKDGGSKIYRYKDFTVIKYNTLDGNKDIYIGIPEMNISISNHNTI